MKSGESFLGGLKRWREEYRRDHDERDQLLRLLAFRDALIALFGLLTLALLFYAGAGSIPVFFILLSLVGASAVMFGSWRIRSGGLSKRGAAVAVLYCGAGLLTGQLLYALAGSAGLVEPKDVEWHITRVTMTVIISLAVYFMMRRTRAPRD